MLAQTIETRWTVMWASTRMTSGCAIEVLGRLGLLNWAGEGNLHGVAHVMDDYWGRTLVIWPGCAMASGADRAGSMGCC